MALTARPVRQLAARLSVQGELIAHRGPDDAGIWTSPDNRVGLAHRRLSIIDLDPSANQPMIGHDGTIIVFNGELYNFIELSREMSSHWNFRTKSDTEVLLAAYARHGEDMLRHLRGMFAFALYDPARKTLLAARDRFGMKPFYYVVVDGVFHFASEMKALLPFLPTIETDRSAFAEYLTFNTTLGSQTLFSGIQQLMPGEMLTVREGRIECRTYWSINYNVDLDTTMDGASERFGELMRDAINVHLRSDVPVGAYVSGGLDSSIVAILAARETGRPRFGFHGKFTDHPGYDESRYAVIAADAANIALEQIDIAARDFRDSISDVIYHLDTPVAGPGSFPQYLVSKLASEKVKVVLGGQGGDEIFGGYARYVVAYLEQALKAAIDGTARGGNYVVTAESIVPNLGSLREYKPLLRQFWSDGLFGPQDERYFRLIDRSLDMRALVEPEVLERERVFEAFRALFNRRGEIEQQSYFDRMTHFEILTLLPALLQVEDRVSMAHGLESRLPFLDHPIVEFVATVPAGIKFKGAAMKLLLKSTFAEELPGEILRRRDKMGFPVPLKEWSEGPLREFLADVMATGLRRGRDLFKSAAYDVSTSGGRFSRRLWVLLSLELWQQRFHDRAAEFRSMFLKAAA